MVVEVSYMVDVFVLIDEMATTPHTSRTDPYF